MTNNVYHIERQCLLNMIRLISYFEPMLGALANKGVYSILLYTHKGQETEVLYQTETYTIESGEM